MESVNQRQLTLVVLTMLMGVVVAGIIGVSLGYVIWGPGAANYSVMSKSNEATRTVTMDSVSVTFPLVIVCNSGEVTTRNVAINNLNNGPMYVSVSLSLVRNSGVDSATISSLTGSAYRVNLAAYATATQVLDLRPSSQGYAIFDLRMNGELLGSIALYVVS